MTIEEEKKELTPVQWVLLIMMAGWSMFMFFFMVMW
jgi:hypothetical protein